jgi:hypothetical protein
MSRRLALTLAVAIAAGLGGCATNKVEEKDMSAFRAAAPRSILVVPAVNKSLDVDAPNYMLSALTVPLAEKGYYVFPVNTTKVVLQQEGFYEGEQIRQQPTPVLAKLFGADAVLYVTINRWDAQYAVIAATVTVEFDYRLVYKDGTEIWTAQQRLQYTPQNNNAGGGALAALVTAVISAAMTRAAPNYMPLTRQANNQVLLVGPNALPDGPYLVAKKPK